MADVDLAGKVTMNDLAQLIADGEFTRHAKTMSKTLPVFADAHWEEANMILADRFSKDSYLASGGLRAINNGIDSTSGKDEQVEESLCLYEDRLEIDQELVRRAPNPGTFRMRKEDSHVRGGSIWIGDKMLYGERKVSDIEAINGFCTRYNDLALANVEDCGDSTGDSVTSIYMVFWGPEKVAFLYPTGDPGGIVKSEDMGRQLLAGANSKKLWKFVTEFYFRYGIRVMNDNCVQRLANIGTGTANNVDVKKLLKLYYNVDEAAGGTEGGVLYANKTGLYQLEAYAMDHPTDHILHWVKVDNKGDVLYFKDLPIHKWDSIKDTEAVVT